MLEELPFALDESTRRGAQVLVDRGMGMAPYRADQKHLVEMLDDVLADDRLEILDFVGCPNRALSNRSAPGPAPWSPPAADVPVVVLTDLGIGGDLVDQGRASVGEWLQFAQSVRRSGHELLAFVPYEASRWPPSLAHAMTPIHWSERTTAAEVRHARRDAKRSRR